MAQKQQQTKSARILRLRDVELKTGRPCSSIYWMMANNTFPRNIQLGKRSVGWLESEIDQWIEDKIKESRAQGGNK
ncbi:Predicted transcriptional regulator [Legionella pneumophila]|uniref:AlpA family transcriptional regulator n=1 Tax=Legionella pneumophila TaxID=446 RepID=UPI0007707E9D|nr:AlpA family transcriptional regulator [Legionella pneumophila]CZG54754.1 Predicted transcriptional regulator [Legionella pneumophila]